MKTYIFQIPIRAGRITVVQDHGQRIKVLKGKGEQTTEYALSRGMARLRRPRVGDYLVEYPHGHIDIMNPEDFTAKAVAGGAGVH